MLFFFKKKVFLLKKLKVTGLLNNLSGIHPLLVIILFFHQKVYIIISALVLGSYWAAQEFNWGGFWAWDLIENGLLLLGVYVLISWHYFKKFFLFFTYKVQYLLIFFFFFKLFNFNSIHSFLTLENYIFFYLFIFLYCVLTNLNIAVRLFCTICISFLYIDITNTIWLYKYISIWFAWFIIFFKKKIHKLIAGVLGICFLFINFNFSKIFLDNYFTQITIYISNTAYILFHGKVIIFSLYLNNLNSFTKYLYIKLGDYGVFLTKFMRLF